MKTIFITIPTGIIARNILRTDVFAILKQRGDLRIVLITPGNCDAHFKQEVASNNVIAHELKNRVRAGALRHFLLYPFMKHLVMTSSTRLYLRYGTSRRHINNPLALFFGVLFFTPLSKLDFLKKACRFLDLKFFAQYDKEIEEVFNQYQPDLVFATNIMHDPADLAFLRVARRKGIASVGMVKSWDNLDKYLLLQTPDTFLVWNEKMKNDLVNLQGFCGDKIEIVGVPQFDIYNDKSIFWTKEEYCQKMGIPENHKIIFFGSEGFAFPYDDEIADIAYNFIKNNDLVLPSFLMVRRHFRELLSDNNRFERFGHLPLAVLDAADRTGECFSRGWDPSREDMIRLANHLYHCDVMLTSCSTLSLDAACFDKPIINIAFDGEKERPKAVSALKWYKLANYQPVIKSGGVRFVHSPQELKQALNDYLQNPQQDKQGRETLRKWLCWKLDGKAGERIAKSLLSKIYK